MISFTRPPAGDESSRDAAVERAAAARQRNRDSTGLFLGLFYMPGLMAGVLLAQLWRSAWGLAAGFGMSLVVATLAVIIQRRRSRRRAVRMRLDGEGRLDVDLPCAHCEYNLRGTRERDHCPECGLNVHRSIYAAELAAARPPFARWLATRIYIAAVTASLAAFVLGMFDETAAFVGFALTFVVVFAVTGLIKGEAAGSN